MNKRPLTTIATHGFEARCLSFCFFLPSISFGLRTHIRRVVTPLTNFETSSNAFRSVNGARTAVRVHDTAERSQITSPQQNYSVTGSSRSIGYYLWRGVPCRARPDGP